MPEVMLDEIAAFRAKWQLRISALSALRRGWRPRSGVEIS
jgi:hypothetical protein